MNRAEKMKTKLYVGIALMVFFVCLVVIFGAGFTETQNYMLNTQTPTQVVIDKNQICSVVANDCQTPASTSNSAPAATANNPGTQSPSSQTSAAGTGTTTPAAPTQTVSPPTTTYVPPPPTPTKRVVTRAS
jgi:cytoskeletal protein RodZ